MIGLARNSSAAPGRRCWPTARAALDRQLLRFAGEVGVARDLDLGGRPGEAQVARLQHAALDADVAGDLVEREALAEDVGEIERDAPRQRLQREHAEQLADAGLDLGEAPRPDVDAERPGQRRIVEVAGRRRPTRGCR